MVYDVAPGDVIHIGDGVRLTIAAVEGDLIRLGVEALDGERSDAGPDCQQAHAKPGWWERN
jgi:hypothetical protein